ncbi:hypothetical protein [Burkholderia latens]|uniref:hypothetical protein n=1 Tax=Burkholderia latens TaxID=488446 RepID=UPI0039A65FC5
MGSSGCAHRMAGASLTRTLASHISARQFGILFNERNFGKIPMSGTDTRTRKKIVPFNEARPGREIARQSRAHPDARRFSAG